MVIRSFNAMYYSKSTNVVREHLARGHPRRVGERVTAGPEGSRYSRRLAANGSQTTHLTSYSYMKVVLDSVFAIFPKGPCKEAIEASSIPVVLRGDLHHTKSIQSTRFMHAFLRIHFAG